MSDKEQPKLSIKEFKMWLQGVEEMQPEGWTPDDRQWKRIRDKINQILDVVPIASRDEALSTMTLPANMAAVFRPLDTSPPPVGSGSNVPLPSALNGPGRPPAPPRSAATPSGLPVTLSTDPNRAVKTPDRDTSSGNYNSEFA